MVKFKDDSYWFYDTYIALFAYEYLLYEYTYRIYLYTNFSITLNKIISYRVTLPSDWIRYSNGLDSKDFDSVKDAQEAIDSFISKLQMIEVFS